MNNATRRSSNRSVGPAWKCGGRARKRKQQKPTAAAVLAAISIPISILFPLTWQWRSIIDCNIERHVHLITARRFYRYLGRLRGCHWLPRRFYPVVPTSVPLPLPLAAEFRNYLERYTSDDRVLPCNREENFACIEILLLLFCSSLTLFLLFFRGGFIWCQRNRSESED